MIKICSFFCLPIEEQRIGPVYSLANSYPRKVGAVAGKVKCLVPPREIVTAFKHRQITEKEYTDCYREHLRRNWQEVKQWLDGLTLEDEMYLCCYERKGFCHRILVAKLIQKFRGDLELEVS